MRKRMLGYFLMLSLLLFAVFFIFSFSATADTHIVDINGNGNFTSIQDAINASSDGDIIYVYNGSYTENIIVNQSVDIIGNDTDGVMVDPLNHSRSLFTITADNVSFQNLSIEDCYDEWGINISNADNLQFCSIYFGEDCYSLSGENCISLYINDSSFYTDGINDTYFGIDLDTCSQVFILRNSGDLCDYEFIAINNSDNITILDNDFGDSDDCIFINQSSDIIIRNNTIDDSDEDGIDIRNSVTLLIENNTIEDAWYDSIYLENVSIISISNNTIINSDEDGIYCLNCSTITVDNNSINESDDDGIDFEYCITVTISNNTIVDTENSGIDLMHVENGTIRNNLVDENDDDGVGLCDLSYCTNLLIVDNIFNNSDWDNVDIEDCENLSVRNNVITNSTDDAIELEDNRIINVSSNYIRYTHEDDEDMGIYLEENNTNVIIWNNTIQDIYNDGIEIDDDGDPNDLIIILSNTIRNTTDGDGIGIAQDNTNVSILNNDIRNCAYDGIDVYEEVDGIIISGNYLFNISNNGIEVEDGCLNVTIQNNMIDNCGNDYFEENDGYGDGIHIYDCENVTVSGNTINNSSDDSISISACDNSTFSANTITNSSEKAFKINGCDGLSVSSNTITHSGDDGINLQYCYHVTISSNLIYNSSDNGMYFDEFCDSTLSGNTINASSNDGIQIADSYNFTFSENHIYNSSEDAMYLEWCEDFAIRDCGFYNNTDDSGESEDMVDVISEYFAINMFSSENVTIEGCRFINESTGCLMGDCSDINYTGNTHQSDPTEDSWIGLYITAFSNNITVCSNTFSGITRDRESDGFLENLAYSVGLFMSLNITAYNNTISDTVCGINVWACGNISFSENTITNASYGLGSTLSGAIPEIFEWLEYGYLFTITNNTISESEVGIGIYNSANLSISSNDLDDNEVGIGILEAYNVTVSENTIDDSSVCGIRARDYESGLLYILNNTIECDSGAGFLTDVAFNGEVSGNTIEGAGMYGMVINDTNYFNITSNTVDGDFTYAIGLYNDSYNNTIYNNYFDGTNDAIDGANNTWNITKTLSENIVGGDYLGGNYWSGYSGSDTNSDGLGDTRTPYNSSGDITYGGDYHPLIIPTPASPPPHQNMVPTKHAPDVDIGGPYSGEPGKSIFFDGSGTVDVDGDNLTYSWSFGDGASASGATASHTYSSEGDYTVRLTVFDGLFTQWEETVVTVETLLIDTDGDGDPDDVPAGNQTGSTEDDDDDDDGLSDELEELLGTDSLNESDVIELNAEYALVDTNGDGKPDTFYDFATEQIGEVVEQEDGIYYVDSDGDGEWDYIYESARSALTPYSQDNGLILWIGIFVVAVIVLLLFVFYKRRKDEEKK